MSTASCTTSRASRPPRLSGSSAALALTAIFVLAGATPAEPVLKKSEDGAVDWTARVVRAIGVGTPKVLSPTGSLTPRDPYVVAREDAQARLGRLLARVRVEPGKRLSEYTELTGRRTAALEAFTTTDAVRFSDGTVHLPVSVPFDWVPAAVAGREPPIAPDDAVVTGLILRVKGKVEPQMRLRLAAGKRTVRAGFPDDPVGAGGVVWFRDEAAARVWPALGARPRVASVTVQRRNLLLSADDANVLDGVPGGLAVVFEK